MSLNRQMLIGVLMITAVGSLAASRLRQTEAPLPYYGAADFTPEWSPVPHRVGAFALTDQRGAAFTEKNLAGRVYVASFIYTRCSVVCPVLVKNLAKVQAATKPGGAMIVSFTVTPDIDTPDVLATFGQERHIDADRWRLLTGSRQTIYGLARDAFFADDDRVRASVDQPDAFLHTEKLVLVDQQGRLRGVYDGTLPRDIDLLIADANALLK